VHTFYIPVTTAAAAAVAVAVSVSVTAILSVIAPLFASALPVTV
jgi:hypothetical protein